MTLLVLYVLLAKSVTVAHAIFLSFETSEVKVGLILVPAGKSLGCGSSVSTASAVSNATRPRVQPSPMRVASTKTPDVDLSPGAQIPRKRRRLTKTSSIVEIIDVESNPTPDTRADTSLHISTVTANVTDTCCVTADDSVHMIDDGDDVSVVQSPGVREKHSDVNTSAASDDSNDSIVLCSPVAPPGRTVHADAAPLGRPKLRRTRSRVFNRGEDPIEVRPYVDPAANSASDPRGVYVTDSDDSDDDALPPANIHTPVKTLCMWVADFVKSAITQ